MHKSISPLKLLLKIVVCSAILFSCLGYVQSLVSQRRRAKAIYEKVKELLKAQRRLFLDEDAPNGYVAVSHLHDGLMAKSKNPFESCSFPLSLLSGVFDRLSMKSDKAVWRKVCATASRDGQIKIEEHIVDGVQATTWEWDDDPYEF